MGIYCNRQLTVSFVIMAFLLLASVSAMPFNPTRHRPPIWVVLGSSKTFSFLSVGARKVKEQIIMAQPAGNDTVPGTGSEPPSCIGKCGECTPCEPVLISVPPLEYYPQIWKCKCGDKLFDP
ncbi:hypothetical protein CASFOL_027472 [Castilleja foliolosa]|uniref:Epidermal patterning factor-like protein n=1 Tax=Castilleja foliolosa TaxID=1961234 RepID=A0ABD3CGG6_9LAMI